MRHLTRLFNWATTSSFTRYILIGGSAFVLDYTLLRVGLWLGLHLLVANGIAVVFSLTYSFIMHRLFTFAHRAKQRGYRMAGHHQLVIFFAVSGASLLLSELFIYFLVHAVRLTPSTSKIITSAILFAWNYTFNRLLTFRTMQHGATTSPID